jgi:predicted Zn-dependent peptidase
LFRINCTVRPGKTLDEAESLISEEVAKMHAEPVTTEELTRVRTSARRSAVTLRESALYRAISLADDAALYKDPDRINTLTEKLTAVTVSDVQRVAKAYLNNNNRVVIRTVPAAPSAPAAKPAVR